MARARTGRWTWGLIVLAAAALRSAAAEPAGIAGKIESVTLYRGQALVTRAAAIEGPAGPMQVVVSGLPERIQPGSLYASVEKGAQVRAVRYRTQPVGETPREEVKAFDDRLESLGRDVRAAQDAQLRLTAQTEYLSKLQNFVAPTALTEMTKGVLNAETIKGVTVFMFEQIEKLGNERLALQEKQRDLARQVELATRERDQITRSRTRVAREAVVFLDKTAAGAVTLHLSYVTDGASWTPAYNVRTGAKATDAQIEYNAVIQQMTGENWDSAALTLSTASPALVAEAPVLGPMLVGLTHEPQVKAVNVGQFKSDVLSNTIRIREFDAQRQEAASRSAQTAPNWDMNETAAGTQGLELSASAESIAVLRETLREQGSGLSVNYKLPGAVSLASRADQQIVRIADVTLPAAFSNVAVPLLTDRVYRVAEVTNNSDVALLEGQSNVYLNGDFVGKGTVPMTAAGQRFVAGFGSDPQLRAWREFISRDEKIQGGNIEVTFTYRLVLDNYKDAPVAVRAFDRMPYAHADIRVTPGAMKDKLSDEAEYRRIQFPHGILRWDVDVPAKSAASTARIVEYSYKMEYDRNMRVAPVGASARGEMMEKMADFMQYQR